MTGSKHLPTLSDAFLAHVSLAVAAGPSATLELLRRIEAGLAQYGESMPLAKKNDMEAVAAWLKLSL